MRYLFGRVVLLGILILAASLAHAQPYPSKTIKIVTPYPPGASNDLIARLLASGMSKGFGQPVIVENRPGAAGTIGTAAVAKSAADGYMLLLANPGPLAISLNFYASLAYDPEKDFAPICVFAYTPVFLVVAASSPFKSLGDLLAAGRQQSGKLNFSSAGNGSISHVGGEWINIVAGRKFVHVPYSGGAPAIAALYAGDVSFFVAAGLDGILGVNQGRMRGLAVMSAARRSPAAPEVPALAEAGLPGLAVDLDYWFGLVAPAKTPRPIIDRIHENLVTTLGDSAIRARLLELGAVSAVNTPEEFADLIKSDIAKYAKIVRSAAARE